MMKINKNRNRLYLLLRYFVIAFWMIFCLLPLYTAFVTSLTKWENIGKTFFYPVDMYYQNYIEVFSRYPLLGFFKATLIYGLGASLINVILASFAAYAISRYRFRGRMFYIGIIFVTQIIPQVVIVVPLFTLLNKVGLYDTYIGVIIAIVATSLAFPIVLLRGFFDTIPIELEEAAYIDGCSPISSLVKIVIPLAAPGIATVFALSFFAGWAQFLYPLVLTVSPDKASLTVGIARLIDNQIPWEMVMTATLLSVIPALVIYLLTQRFLIKGLTGGAFK